MAKPEIDWLVYVNGVEVGQVPHEEMEQITATVKRDWVVYVSQGVEVLKTALRMLKLAVMCAPAVALLLLVFDALSSPVEFDRDFQLRSPHELVLAYAAFGYLIAGGTTLVMLAMGCRFGFQNQFTARVVRSTRRFLAVPADGEVQIEGIHRHPQPPVMSWWQILRAALKPLCKSGEVQPPAQG
ncbi:hypothetical protein H2O04_22975 [Pseudomonas aeruginosa]|uniref:hypothetical protein n=1 Tax=Pseudomonas aeruginosa TaxID=287 RepID=UPI0015F0A35B|nr:hypothetical protein [Pseudomonas aeruginosa]MBA5026709.1 hypothetical protein [Pseudomonas aeruginosa]MBA5132270.1 hypothetical protein [Pseudomonas aeruginosa]